MERMIAYCGLDCLQCPAYKATQAGDMPASAKVAEAWTEQYGGGEKTFTAEDTICDGCVSESERKGIYCGLCPIRACSMGKGLENCAHCEDYACEQLTQFLDFASEAKKNLEEIRADM